MKPNKKKLFFYSHQNLLLQNIINHFCDCINHFFFHSIKKNKEKTNL